MRRIRPAYIQILAVGLALATSAIPSEAREYKAQRHASPPSHHVYRHQNYRHDFAPDAFAYSRNGGGPAWRGMIPGGNTFGPGEYDRLVNGSDASTPGHN